MGAELAISPPTVSLQAGAIIGGRYEIVDVLSYGAMGIIYRARHRTLGMPLALKAMRPELATEESYSRFADEARNAALLRSEHVARVFDFGRLPSGELYLVMELLEGEDLSSVLAVSGALPVELGMRIALQACEALGEAHAAGIIHRDLKPENLFLARTPSGEAQLKILDFGVSKRVRGPRRHATIAGTVGSPHYMAPEQLRSARDIDQRADVWGLGVVLYELFAGQPAFEGDSVAEICTQVLTTKPPPLVQVRPEVGAKLSRVIARCLESDRDRRFQSMEELAAALEAVAELPAVHFAGEEGTGRTMIKALSRASWPEIPGVRRYRVGRIFGAIALTALLAGVVSCAYLGPSRSLELARRTAAVHLVGGAQANRVPQPLVDQPSRALLPVAEPPPPVVEPPPPPAPKPRPKAMRKSKPPPPVVPETVVLPEEPSETAAVTAEDGAPH